MQEKVSKAILSCRESAQAVKTLSNARADTEAWREGRRETRVETAWVGSA
jgi:hypothetical protein